MCGRGVGVERSRVGERVSRGEALFSPNLLHLAGSKRGSEP